MAIDEQKQATPSAAVLQRLATLRETITRRARDCGRDPASIRLVAVTKTFSAEQVWPTIAEGGQLLFGENRVQEAKPKWSDLRARAAALGKTIDLHLIGPLQSNKAREAIEIFDAIETLDREKLAEALAEAMAKTGRRPRLFVQVNTGSEPQKAGVEPAEADAFIALAREKYKLSIDGLMCIPPLNEQASPHFALLGQIAKRNGIKELSMGMSADFELAIQLGATYVRVGSAIFGSRA
ncbi:MAG TPA: YggS family pyridoxal phosphate-dependent enzyme [Roseiarcus sp.]|nr:YggS family pyridoxal phosphate-dependent enzyme [Roseiarcus sp.]